MVELENPIESSMPSGDAFGTIHMAQISRTGAELMKNSVEYKVKDEPWYASMPEIVRAEKFASNAEHIAKEYDIWQAAMFEMTRAFYLVFKTILKVLISIEAKLG